MYTKKIIGFISVICICLCIMSACVCASDISNEERFLGYLNIADAIDLSSDTPITRAEFTAMLVRAVNGQNIASPDSSFEDVEKNHAFANEIYSAKALKITNGTSAVTFSPDEPIVTDGAVKMSVIALGYGEYAAAVGEYGYQTVASKLRIMKGVSSSATLSRKDALVLIYNVLNANVNEATGVSAEDIIYSADGTKLIEKAFSLKSAEGVVTTAGYVSESDEDSDEYKFVVGGKSLRCTYPSSGFFGMSVTAWYDKDTSEVVAIDESADNSMLMIMSDDIESYSDFELKAHINGKDKKIRFDKKYAYIKNGRIYSHTADDFDFNGLAVVRDNNGDGLYDYFLAFCAEYYIVSSIDKAESVIYDRNSDIRYIELEPDDGECMIFTINVSDMTFERSDISVIKEDGVYMVFQSDDRKVCAIVASPSGENVVSAMISETDGESYVAGGTKYTRNQYFVKRGLSLNVGSEYELYIAPDGTLTDVKGAVGKSAYYGYVLDTTTKRGMDNVLMAKILCQDGKYQTYNFAKKVKIDGNTASQGTATHTALGDGTTYVRKLIRYSLNEHDEISVIDTAEQTQISDSISVSYNSDNSLKCYANQISGQYKGSGNLIIPKFSIKKAVIFTVPNSLAANPLGDFDDDTFRVSTTSVLDNDATYTLDAYDLDEDYFPAAVVIYCNSSASAVASTASQYTGSFMVTKVTDVTDIDGNLTKRVYGFRNRKHVEFLIDADVLPQLTTEGRIPKAGDVIRAVFNTDNEINGISIDLSYDQTQEKAIINYGQEQLSTSANSYFTYVGGNVITAGTESLVIYADQTPTSSSSAYTNGIAPISLSSPQYVIFNTTTGDVYEGRATDLLGGESNGRYAICRMNYYQCNTVYIYIK